MIGQLASRGREDWRRRIKENFADFCDRQELRLQERLSRATPSQVLKRRNEHPTRAEIIEFGTVESRGNTAHATGERKHAR